MKINATSSMRDFADTFEKMIGSGPVQKDMAKNGFNHIADKVEFNMGPSLDRSGNDEFEIDAHASEFPMHAGREYMGDEIGKNTAVMDAVKKDPASLLVRYQWNRKTGKLDIVYDAKVNGKMVGDSARYTRDGIVADAPLNLINAQLFSPASAGWISRPFYQVLGYSKAMEAVKVETGSNPFATALNLPLIAFGGGFASLSGAGAFNNTDTFDVDARADAMSNTVLNFEATYRLTVEEKARTEYGDTAPFGGKVLSAKIKYASWTMDMFRDVLIWYGNTSTGTNGILNVGSVVAWASSGFGTQRSLNYIKINSLTTPGAEAYNNLAQAVVQFLTVNQNKVSYIKIFMSPLAYNLLASMPYSTTYNPASALQTLVDNFLAGATPNDVTPRIEIIPEPLLSATVLGITNIWNANTYDYMAIIAPEIPGGIPEETQPLVIAGIPLQKYMYPAVPGTYQTQYKMLTRYAGLFVPYTPAVAVYSGYGVLTSTT